MYKAFLETLLTASKEAAESHMRSSLWLQDAAGEHDTLNEFPTANGKSSHSKRGMMIATSREVPFATPFQHDLFQSDRLWPPVRRIGCDTIIR